MESMHSVKDGEITILKIMNPGFYFVKCSACDSSGYHPIGIWGLLPCEVTNGVETIVEKWNAWRGQQFENKVLTILKDFETKTFKSFSKIRTVQFGSMQLSNNKTTNSFKSLLLNENCGFHSFNFYRDYNYIIKLVDEHKLREETPEIWNSPPPQQFGVTPSRKLLIDGLLSGNFDNVFEHLSKSDFEEMVCSSTFPTGNVKGEVGNIQIDPKIKPARRKKSSLSKPTVIDKCPIVVSPVVTNNHEENISMSLNSPINVPLSPSPSTLTPTNAPQRCASTHLELLQNLTSQVKPLNTENVTPALESGENEVSSAKTCENEVPDARTCENEVPAARAWENEVPAAKSKKSEWLKLGKNEFYDVVISEVFSDASFFATQHNETIREQLSKFELKKMNIKDIAINKMCVANYLDEFYRCRICRIKNNKALVLFVDYGDTERVPFSSLYVLPDIKIPFQVIECELAGVNIRDTSDSINFLLKESIKDDELKTIKLKVFYIEAKKGVTDFRHKVILIDPTDNSTLNHKLVENNWAEWEKINYADLISFELQEYLDILT